MGIGNIKNQGADMLKPSFTTTSAFMRKLTSIWMAGGEFSLPLASFGIARHRHVCDVSTNLCLFQLVRKVIIILVAKFDRAAGARLKKPKIHQRRPGHMTVVEPATRIYMSGIFCGIENSRECISQKIKSNQSRHCHANDLWEVAMGPRRIIRISPLHGCCPRFHPSCNH